MLGIALLSSWLASVFGDEAFPANMRTALAISAVAMTLGFILIPLAIRFGAARASMGLLIVMAILLGLIVLTDPGEWLPTQPVSGTLVALGVAALPIVTAAIAYPLSVRWYEQKDL